MNRHVGCGFEQLVAVHPRPSVHLRAHGLFEREDLPLRGIRELDGVRYLGQSLLFVDRARLARLREFLRANGVEHVISEATLGRILAN